MGFPSAVHAAKHYLARIGDHKKLELLDKLSRPMDPDHEKMWCHIESKRSSHDCHWVLAFLAAVQSCANLPPYFYVSGRERRTLSKRIRDLSSDLVALIRDNQLDGQLVLLTDKMWNGFYLLEDFSEVKRRRIMAGAPKTLAITAFLASLAEHAASHISEADWEGKKGKSIGAVRFVRKLAELNEMVYASRMKSVIATVTNTLFETSYLESDIQNLLARPRNRNSRQTSEAGKQSGKP